MLTYSVVPVSRSFTTTLVVPPAANSYATTRPSALTAGLAQPVHTRALVRRVRLVRGIVVPPTGTFVMVMTGSLRRSCRKMAILLTLLAAVFEFTVKKTKRESALKTGLVAATERAVELELNALGV